jgi:anti-sigma-K factor RskA
MNDEDDMLAAEFALGLLDEQEREAMRRRLDTDTALAQRVEWWRERFEPLSSQDEVAPSDALWSRIEAALPVNDNPALAEARRWRAAALAAMLVAALLGTTMILRPGTTPQQAAPAGAPTPDPVLLASLTGDDGVVATIAYERAAGQITIVPDLKAADPDLRAGAPELWIIPAGGSPRSLGTIDPQRPSKVAARAGGRALIVPGATFAISLEPRGGSPSGKPTGPILGSGTISGT